MFLPLNPPKEPDTILLEENSFVATAENELSCASKRTRKGGHCGDPWTSTVPTSVQLFCPLVEHPPTLHFEQSARSSYKVPDTWAIYRQNFDFLVRFS